ncbi:Chaperone protein DnaJ [Pseudocercospora fuligena]|uniref:Chaperone protein DnaJ n=1 Tax=Pseudocercospora fuligena TaxID=685502 RepID=A0A8H6R9D0_9PEZI|nr:Chaperone protein DnaJ [Pseudocercospora fuligena]
MAPLPPKDDHYSILEVEHSATADVITKSYRSLALKLHPDRNSKSDATESFQKLGQAFETLIDPVKRQAYDRVYHTVRQNGVPSSDGSHRAQPSKAASYADQIKTLLKAKRDRAAEWQSTKDAFELSIDYIRALIEDTEQSMAKIDALFASVQARQDDWSACIKLHLSRDGIEASSEEIQLRKDRARLEHKRERDLSKWRLRGLKENLQREEDAFASSKMEIDYADGEDDWSVRVLRKQMEAEQG